MHLPTHLLKYAGELSRIFLQASPTKTEHAAWGSQGSRRNGLFPDNSMPLNLFGLVCRYQEPTRGKGRRPSVFCTPSNVLYISLPPGPCRSNRRSVLLDLNSFAKTVVRVSEVSDPRGPFPLIGRFKAGWRCTIFLEEAASRKLAWWAGAIKRWVVAGYWEKSFYGLENGRRSIRILTLLELFWKERRHFGFSYNSGLLYLLISLEHLELVDKQLVLIMSATSFNMACQDTDISFNFFLRYKQSEQCLKSIIDITLSDFSVQDPPSPPPYPPNPPPSPAWFGALFLGQ